MSTAVQSLVDQTNSNNNPVGWDYCGEFARPRLCACNRSWRSAAQQSALQALRCSLLLCLLADALAWRLPQASVCSLQLMHVRAATGYTWSISEGDYCWSYTDGEWSYCGVDGAPIDSKYNTYCYDINLNYVDVYYEDPTDSSSPTPPYCGMPTGISSFTFAGGYWFDDSASCSSSDQQLSDCAYQSYTSTSTSSTTTSSSSSDAWAQYVSVPLPAGISFEWTSLTSFGCTCTDACQSGPLVASETEPRDFTWCHVEPGCGPGDVWDVFTIVNYDICGYALNTSALVAPDDFKTCAATDPTACTAENMSVPGSLTPKWWKAPCTNSTGGKSPHPGWYDCYTGSSTDENYLNDLFAVVASDCDYTCSWWDAANNGFVSGGWPPEPSPPAPPPAAFLSFNTLSSFGPVNVSDMVVLVGYSKPDNHGSSTTKLLPDDLTTLTNLIASVLSYFNVTTDNVTLTSFVDVPTDALAGRRLLQTPAAVAVSFTVTTSGKENAGFVSSSLQALASDPYNVAQFLMANGLNNTQSVMFPLLPVMKDSSGTCMAGFDAAASSSAPPPSSSELYFYSSDSANFYYGGGYGGLTGSTSSSSSSDTGGKSSSQAQNIMGGLAPPPPPSPAHSRPPKPPPPAPPPPSAYPASPVNVVNVASYLQMKDALISVKALSSLTIVIQRDIFVTTTLLASKKPPADLTAIFMLQTQSNITIIGNTSSCISYRNGNTNTGPCVLDGGNLTRLFATSDVGIYVSTVAHPTYINFLNLTLSGGMVTKAVDSVKSSGGGMLLALYSTVLLIDGCVITGNSALAPLSARYPLHGGAIYMWQPLALRMTNSVLSGNQAPRGDGGALYIDLSTSTTSRNFSLTGVIFEQNQATRGGALAFDSGVPANTRVALTSSLTLSNVSCDQNTADDSGGAIFAGSLPGLSISNSAFTGNVAQTGSGGAVAGNYYASSYTFISTSFVGNNASDEGGALAFVDIVEKVAPPISFTATSTTWSNNNVLSGVAGGASGNGGALSLTCFRSGSSKCIFTVVITNSTLSYNRGKGAGGALYVGPALSVTMSDTVVTGNFAVGPYARGGGVAFENALSVSNVRCTYSGNDINAILAPDPVVSRPSVVYVGAGFGGAIYAASQSSLWAPAKYLPVLQAPGLANMSLTSCSFVGNSAPAAGALAASGYATLASNCVFTDNKAEGAVSLGLSGDGGALLVKAFGSTSVANCTLSGNSAAQRGGAIAALLSPTSAPNSGNNSLSAGETAHKLAVSAGTTLVNNSATLGGGAFFLETSAAFNSSAATGVVSFANVSALGNTALAGAVVFTANCTYKKNGDVSLCTQFALPSCSGACVGFTAAGAAAAGNNATSHGQFMASAPASFSLSIGGVTSGTATVPSGLAWPSPLSVSSSDFYGQAVTRWDDGSGAGGLVFSVSLLNASTTLVAQGSLQVQGTTQTIALPLDGSGGSGWMALTSTGYELATGTLLVTAPNYIFPSPQARSATISVQIGVCGPGMKAVGTTCTCVSNALINLGGLSCHCLPSFFLTPPAELATTTYAGVANMNWTCGSCPPGASCTGDDFFIGTDGYWHLPAPDAPMAPAARRSVLAAPAAGNVSVPHSAAFFMDTTFYDCRQGLCLAMDPNWVDQNLSAPAPRCREGHTGPVCELCAQGYSYQGQFCGPCAPSDAFSAWSRARRVVLGVFVAIAAALGVTFLFFWPLLPNLQSAVYDAARSLADPQAVVLEARRRVRMLSTGQHHERDASDDNSGVIPDTGFLGELLNNKFSGGGAALKEQLRKMAKDAAAPMKTLFTFVQLIISFSHSLSVPWPHAYLQISSSLNFVALDFFSMPNSACANPGLTFYTKFMGETLGLTTAIAGIGLLYLVGSACVPRMHFGGSHDTREARKRRRLYFQATCLSRLLLLAYLVYPNISKVVVDMFACRRVGGVDYLVADFRIQCSGARYNSYFGAAIFWTIVFPLGVPAAFLALLLKYDVPRLAARRAQTAWLDAALKEVWRVAALECDTARQLRAAVGVDEALTVSTLPELRAAQLLEDFTFGAFDESALADSAHLQDETHAVAASLLDGSHPEAHDLKAEQSVVTANAKPAPPAAGDAAAPADGDRYAALKQAHRRIVHTSHHSTALVVLSVSGLLHMLAVPFIALAARARHVQAHLEESAQAAKLHLKYKARSLSARKAATAAEGAAPEASETASPQPAGGKGCLGASKRVAGACRISTPIGAEDTESGAPAPPPAAAALPPKWATTIFEERHRDALALADAARKSGKLSIAPPVWRSESQTEEAMLFAIGRLGVAISRVDPALLASLAEAQAADEDNTEAPEPRAEWLSRLIGPPTVRHRARRLSALDYMFKLLAVRRVRLEEMETAEAEGEKAAASSVNTDLLVAIRASELKRCLAAASALVATFDDAADAEHAALAERLQAEADAAFAADPPPKLLFGYLPPPPPEAEVPPRPPRGPAGGLRAVAGFLEELLLLYEEGVAVRGLPFLLTSYTCSCWYWCVHSCCGAGSPAAKLD